MASDHDKIYEKIFALTELYSIEDYQLYNMTNIFLPDLANKDNANPLEHIRVLFDFFNQDKEIVVNKKNAKQLYLFLKIKYDINDMNLILYKNEKYNLDYVLQKINSRKNIKGFIKIKLKLNDFPLKNYILEETNETETDFDKILLLKKKNNNHINNNNKTTLVTKELNSINNLTETKIILKENNHSSQNFDVNRTQIYMQNYSDHYQNNITNQNNKGYNNINNNNQNISININMNLNNNTNNNINNNINNFNPNNNYLLNNCNQNQAMNNNFNFNLMNSNINLSSNSYNNTNYVGQNVMNSNSNLNNNSKMNNNSMNAFNMNNNSMNNLCMNSMGGMNSMSGMNSLSGFNSMSGTNSMNNMICMNNMSCMNSMNSMNCMNYMNSMNGMNSINNIIFSNTMPVLNNNINFNINNMDLNLKKNNNSQINQIGNNKDIIDFKLSFNDNDKNLNLFPFVGLRNVGMTCYMNSTLQCLIHIPELNRFFFNIYAFEKKKFKNINKTAETKGYLSEKYYDLLCEIAAIEMDDYRSSKSISPNSFHNAIGTLNPQFREFDANDSKDLLLFLFQSMHEELNYNGDKKLQGVPSCDQTKPQEALNFFLTVNQELNLSIFSYLFYGIFKSETSCLVCKRKFYNFQYFQIISFPLYEYKNEKEFNIYRGFKDYIKPEKMEGDNQCYCQQCKKLTVSEVQNKIFLTPPYLIINLDYGKNKKYNPGKIKFGESLDLTGFTVPDCSGRMYQLVAISAHIGESGRSGHYIAYCKNTIKNNNYNNWYEFNDSSVSKVKFEDINRYSPYFLIFKKVDQSIL